MSGYAIRLAHAGDLHHLATIERAAAALFEPYGFAEQFAAETTPVDDLAAGARERRLWVAVDASGAPVGFVLCGELDGNAHVHEVDVHPAHGRRGLGRALVGQVTAWARRRRLAAVTLTTFGDVPWNAPFYEQLGFRVLARDELPDALRDLLHHEVARGLPADRRVAMRKPVA